MPTGRTAAAHDRKRMCSVLAAVLSVNVTRAVTVRIPSAAVTSAVHGALPRFARTRRVQPLPLAAGDWLVFLTDGPVERNGDIDIQALVAQGAQMPPREAVQHLIHAVLNASEGELKDDATIMCLDWHGGSRHQRTSDSGADS